MQPSILEINPLLDFYETINLTTGEMKTTNRNGNKVTPSKNASYKGLEFKIYDTGTITLSGSLHKYWNDGAHNYNDFNNEAVLFILNDLNTKFDIDPSKCILKCLEIGINITPLVPTNEILDNCLLHKTKPFEYQKNSDEGKYKQVQHSQYIIKIYNKALHYKSKGFKIKDEIMRFEIKYTKMQKLNEKGIFSLQDLINYGLQNFKDTVLKEWQNVLFYDNTIQIDPLTIMSKRIVFNDDNDTKKLICKVTGFNISMQKENSILLSHTGLKYYYNTDKRIFEQIKRRYLTKIWFKSNFETQIKEIAHNIRNENSNKTKKQKRIYQPQQINILNQLGI